MRILLHLAGKIDRSQPDCPPTHKQRSTLELLRYLSVMGPELIASIRSGEFDQAAWQASLAAADRLNVDQVLDAIERQATRYAELIGEFSEADFRTEIEMFFRKASRGSIIVNIVLCVATAKSPAPCGVVTSRGTTGTDVPRVSRRLRSKGMARSVPAAVYTRWPLDT